MPQQQTDKLYDSSKNDGLLTEQSTHSVQAGANFTILPQQELKPKDIFKK